MTAGDRGFTLIEMIVALGLFALISLAGLGLIDAVVGVEHGTAGRLERIGDIDRALVVLTRDVDAVAGPVDGDARSVGLARSGAAAAIRYALTADGLERTRDGQAVLLLDRVEGGRWHYLGADGWHDRWPASAADPRLRPRAVALDLELAGGGVRRVIDLPGQAP